MSMLGQSFYIAFGGNLLLSWGLLPVPSRASAARRRMPGPAALAGMLASAAAASLLHGLAFRWLLTPAGLESLAPFVFALALILVYSAFAAVAARLPGSPPRPEADADRPVPASLVLYAGVLAAGGLRTGMAGVMASAAAAVLGFSLASTLLEDILARQELEPVPASFEGLPSRLLTAGLMALAFSGVDEAFFSRIFPG